MRGFPRNPTQPPTKGVYMAKTRVHNLAKDYGMSSKEMLDHLAQLKIPVKSASSTIEDAYTVSYTHLTLPTKRIV